MSRQLFEEARKVLTQEAAVKLDPVGQEDKDIDNDRDVDTTDKYLHKRRKAISAAIASSKNESSLSDEDIAKLKDILGEQGVAEGSDVTDYNPKSQGGTRKELLAKYHKTKDPKDAEAARRAGATQKELQGVAEGAESKQEYHDRMHRLAAGYRDMSPEAIARKKRIPGWEDQYNQALAYVKEHPNKSVAEEASQGDIEEGATRPVEDPRDNLDRLHPQHPGNRGMGRPLKDKIRQRTGRDVYGIGRAAAGMKPIHHYANKPNLPEETVSEGRPYSASHRIGRGGYTRGSFGLGSSNLDLGGRREAPPASKPTTPAPKPTEDKKKNEEAGQEELHPQAQQVLKHIKPEFHHIYKPYLTKDIFRNNYRDRADLYTAAERAGHTIEEEVEQIDEISQALKNKVQDARRSQAVDTDLGWGPEVPGHRPVSTATRNRLLQMVGGKGNEPYAKYVLGSHLGKRSRGDLQAAESYELEEVEQIDEVGDTPAGRQMLAKYINKAARRVGVHSAIATGYSSTADDNTASPAQRMAATTLAAQQKHKRDMRLRGVERATNRLTQEEIEQEDFELIENLNFALPENPSYQDFIKAALTIAECNSFSELSEEDQQYIISEMEDAFRNNDLSFIAEAEALSDMNDTVQRLRKAGHRIEDMGKDYKGQPYYVYVDKGTGLRRKVTYKGNQKVTQNMGKAAPEDTNEA